MLNVQTIPERQLQQLVHNLFHPASFSRCGKKDDSTEAMKTWLQQFKIANAEVKIVPENELEQAINCLSFDKSMLWHSIFPLPERWARMIGASLEHLHQSMDELLFEVYQCVFDVLIEKFGAGELTKFFTVQSMAIATFVIASKAAEDENFYKPIVQLYETGHCIVGINKHTLLIS